MSSTSLFPNKRCLKILFAPQTDKKRVVDDSEGRLWADAKGFHYYETSAQTGDGINEMFQVSPPVAGIKLERTDHCVHNEPDYHNSFVTDQSVLSILIRHKRFYHSFTTTDSSLLFPRSPLYESLSVVYVFGCRHYLKVLSTRWRVEGSDRPSLYS